MRDCEYVARALLDGIEVNFRLHCIDDGKVKKQPPDLTAGEFNRSE